MSFWVRLGNGILPNLISAVIIEKYSGIRRKENNKGREFNKKNESGKLGGKGGDSVKG